jgi:hypothetical protein
MDGFAGTQDRVPSAAIGSIEPRRVGARMTIASAAVAGALAIAAIAAVALPQRGAPASVSAGDPLVSRSVVEFRASERAGTAAVSDPLLSSSGIQFRAEERGAGNAAADPLVSRSLVEFRAQERGSYSGD